MEDRKFICPCYRHKDDIAAMGHCICHLFVGENYQPLDLADPPMREPGSPWPEIVVYGAYGCQDTVRTRRVLNAHGIPYAVADVDYDPAAAQKVMDWNGGNLSTPTLEIDGRVVSEPSDEELAQILGLA